MRYIVSLLPPGLTSEFYDDLLDYECPMELDPFWHVSDDEDTDADEEGPETQEWNKLKDEHREFARRFGKLMENYQIP